MTVIDLNAIELNVITHYYGLHKTYDIVIYAYIYQSNTIKQVLKFLYVQKFLLP